MSILETHNLSKHFGGVRAVNNLSLNFPAGKITGLIGPNGSGKSTLINILTGIHSMDAGRVSFGGQKLNKINSPEIPVYGLTRTFQEVRLFEQMPVLDNILVALTERDVFRSILERHTIFHLKRAEEILKIVGLWEKRHALAKELSYGQRKLLEIGRALAMEPKIILLDEPYAGLFPEMVKHVSDIVKQLRAAGKTVVLVEHNMQLIRELCDWVIVMDSGELLSEGEPEKVLSQKEVVEAYLGE